MKAGTAVYGLEGEQIQAPASATPEETKPAVSRESEEAIETFVQTFNASFQYGDVNTLLGILPQP